MFLGGLGREREVGNDGGPTEANANRWIRQGDPGRVYTCRRLGRTGARKGDVNYLFLKLEKMSVCDKEDNQSIKGL